MTEMQWRDAKSDGARDRDAVERRESRRSARPRWTEAGNPPSNDNDDRPATRDQDCEINWERDRDRRDNLELEGDKREDRRARELNKGENSKNIIKHRFHNILLSYQSHGSL